MALMAGASRTQAPTSTPGAGFGSGEAKALELPRTKVVVMRERIDGFMSAPVDVRYVEIGMSETSWINR
ncbi:uncharacterized protein RHO25_011122 [Cercospora beticola]|uniref:Uncharacterized protein n=1 Tax=Cercospora beticola TaxID=122368 RepID=A0ABZ0P4D8_CERBT|nr:hypothetical protein RHO25_011122 [Cercospora beticola]